MDGFSKEEFLALLEAARARRERDFLFLLMAGLHGLRVSEVLAIKRSDIADGFLTVKRLKGSRKTVQPLLEHENPLLNERAAVFEFVRLFKPNQRLFNINRRQADYLIKDYGETAGIAKHKLHMHALKHTTGHELIGKVKVNEVQRWLGHKSGASTLKYMEVNDSEAAHAVVRSRPFD